MRAAMAATELAWGTVGVVDPGPEAASVLAHRADIDGVTIVALHNFGASKTTARLPLADLAGRELHDVLDGTRKAVRIPEGTTFDVSLPPYGFRWLRSTPTTA